MKFEVGDVVTLKPREKTCRGYTQEAHTSKARVKCIPSLRVGLGEKMDVVWLGAASHIQSDGDYPVQDFLPFYNGLQLAIRKAKEL